METFEKSLCFGKVGESLIARWIRDHGFTVLPVYEIEENKGKGPQLYTPVECLIAPDMFAFSSSMAFWIEAKHKTGFTMYRLTRRWCTGIDLRHYADYCKVDDSTPWDVWLLFLQSGGKTKDWPEKSPAGLYGNTLGFLRKNEDHRYVDGGMVYWWERNLKKLAEYDGSKIGQTLINPFTDGLCAAPKPSAPEPTKQRTDAEIVAMTRQRPCAQGIQLTLFGPSPTHNPHTGGAMDPG